VLRANAAELGLAECLSGVVHDAVEYELEAGAAYRRLRESWGALRPEPCPYRPADLRRAVDVLDELGRRWRTVGPGERLALRWTMPAGPVPVSRSDRRPATARRARAVASR